MRPRSSARSRPSATTSCAPSRPRLRESGDTAQLGIGISVYVEVTNGGAEPEFGAVSITPEGRAILLTGSFAHGQGHETSYAQIVADRLGLDLDAVTVVAGDTDVVARGGGTYGSKSLQIGGTAAAAASTEVVEKAKQLVADELEANPDDVVLDLDDGSLPRRRCARAGLTWAELAARLVDERTARRARAPSTTSSPKRGTFPFGAHVAVVEVDTETGGVELERLVAVDDAGRIISPRSPRASATAVSAAASARRSTRSSSTTRTATRSPATCSATRSRPPPSCRRSSSCAMETPTPMNELGAKGIGESGTIGATPAVHNAVIDALAPSASATWTCPRTARTSGARSSPLVLVTWPRDDAKLARVQALMAEQELDALVVRAPDNVLYLTDYWGMKGYDLAVFPARASLCWPFSSRRPGRRGARGRPSSVSSQATTRATLGRRRPAPSRRRKGGPSAATSGSASSSRSARRPPTGWSASRPRSRGDFLRRLRAAVEDATPLLVEARAIKTSQELERMRLANGLAAEAMEHVRALLRPGMKESEPERSLERDTSTARARAIGGR